MKRKIYSKLLEWKESSEGRSALLIDGARRVGKSYIVEEFGRNEYESFIIIDFNNTTEQVRDLFRNYLHDLDTFFMYLGLFCNVTLHTRRSLIVFDEVQTFPQARAAIKYLVKDGRYDYIETGSLVSLNRNVKDIIIPSEEVRLQMFPMDFEEFLWAMGENSLMSLIALQYSQRKPMGQDMHRKAMTLFRLYMIVGGMPQAVETYVRTRDFQKTDQVKRAIISLYRNDIQKYAETDAIKVTRIFDQIASQLQRHETRFVLSDVKQGARMREYETAFFWLSESMVVNICYGATEPSIGLNMKMDGSSLKCYMADTGLLISMAFDENTIASESLYKKLMMDKLEINAGMLMENVVAQMLRASGHRLFFYASYSRESADRMEIDFLVAKASISNRHNISPIEVKSTSRYSTISLNKCISKYRNFLSTPYVVHASDLKEENGIIYIPLYMAGLL
jgi:uncharacterized protein